MKIEYFTDENFNNLHKKYKELIKIKKDNAENVSQNDNIDFDRNDIKTKEKEEIFDKNEKD